MKQALLLFFLSVALFSSAQTGNTYARVTAVKEVVTARSLGLTGIGDETGKLQRALAGMNGRELLIEDMTIHISGSLAGNNGNGVAVEGNGGKVKIRGKNGRLKIDLGPNNAYPARGLYIRNATEVSITGLEIDCTGIPGGPNSGMRAVYIDGCTNVTFYDNYVHHNGHIGLSCVNCSNVSVRYNKMYFLDSAIFLQGDVSNLEVVDNTIKWGTSEGIGIFNSDPGASAVQIPRNWIIARNYIEGKTGSYGLNVCNATQGIIRDNTIIRCLGGMMFYDTGSGVAYNRYSTHIEVFKNTMTDLQFGINNIGSYFNVHHNRLEKIARCALMTNNYVGRNGQLDTTVRSTGVRIEHNVLVNCTDKKDPAWQLVQLYNLDSSVFAGNQALQCLFSYPGILMQRCNGLTITGNQMKEVLLTLGYQTNFRSAANHIRKNTFKDSFMFDANRNRQRLPANLQRWTWSDNVLSPAR